MREIRKRGTGTVGTAMVGLLVLLAGGRGAHADVGPPPPDGMQVLAQGPVHEAFAEPEITQPEPGPIAPKPPPDPVDEIPPDQKPEGDNVQWIPGYWSWDADRNDYIWVSGCWREAPPGRRWLAGHWQEVEQGWQWVPGFWAPANLEDLQYLPPPPPTLDQGPSSPSPDDNSTYVPGCWFYTQSRYHWRPGYWVANQPNWVWMPASYIWTTAGCLFNDGYWDHPLDERGLLFAPCVFGRGWGNRPYVPEYVVNSDFLLGALFVQPAADQYYFGDYFDKRYAARGFVPWPDYRIGRVSYDPLYGYYRHLHRANPHWETGLRELYRARAGGEVPRLPHTWSQQVQSLRTINANKSGNNAIHKNINLSHSQNVTALAPLKEVHNSRVTNLGGLNQPKGAATAGRVMKLESVPNENQAREQRAAAQLRAAGQERRAVEGRMFNAGGVPVMHTDAARTAKLQAPRANPPVAASHAVRKPVPPQPMVPKHEERPIPKFTPPRAAAPPRHGKH